MLEFKDKNIKFMYDIVKRKKKRVYDISEIEQKLEKDIPLSSSEKIKLKRYKDEELISTFYIGNGDKLSIEYQVDRLSVSNLIEEFIEMNKDGNLLKIKVSSGLIDIEKLYTHNIKINKLISDLIFESQEECDNKPNSRILEIDKLLKFKLFDSDIIMGKNIMIIINDSYELFMEVSNYKSLKELEELELSKKLKNKNVNLSRTLLELSESF